MPSAGPGLRGGRQTFRPAGLTGLGDGADRSATVHDLLCLHIQVAAGGKSRIDPVMAILAAAELGIQRSHAEKAEDEEPGHAVAGPSGDECSHSHRTYHTSAQAGSSLTPGQAAAIPQCVGSNRATSRR